MRHQHAIVAAIIPVVIAFGCVKEKKAEIPVTVVNKVGTVSLNIPGNNLPVDAALHVGDRILTGDKSMVTLSFPMDSAVRVYEKSEFIISVMGPAGTAGDDETEFIAKKGGALLVISKLAKPGSLRVKTPTAVASVRGTTFMVSVDDAGRSDAGPRTGVKVLSGTVHVAALNRPQLSCLVRKGEMIEVSDIIPATDATAIPRNTLDELTREESTLQKISAHEGSFVEDGQAEAFSRIAEKPAPELKTEKAIRQYYRKLEEVSLDDGTILVGAVIYQNASVARIHTVHGVIQVPTGSIKTIRMR
ncbi:MAG: FecR domain-containing protein [Spirochaetes bacterium]|nr:FecR domain-containing protein [Spirochaetota bacterium]